MEKTIIAVQHISGRQERLCPKCRSLMTFQDGGYDEFLGSFGTYDQVEFSDCWYCPDCGYTEEIE
jgi:ribosomal protein S27AE